MTVSRITLIDRCCLRNPKPKYEGECVFDQLTNSINSPKVFVFANELVSLRVDHATL